MKNYRFYKPEWDFDFMEVGIKEVFAYVRAESKDDAIRILYETWGRKFDDRVERIDTVNEIPKKN